MNLKFRFLKLKIGVWILKKKIFLCTFLILRLKSYKKKLLPWWYIFLFRLQKNVYFYIFCTKAIEFGCTKNHDFWHDWQFSIPQNSNNFSNYNRHQGKFVQATGKNDQESPNSPVSFICLPTEERYLLRSLSQAQSTVKFSFFFMVRDTN